ncbi:ORF54 [Ostreid herpesvirus 1]|uniref:Uncharacterized protein ORF54 n=2 Tax=Ostreid herpesvirus 1 TaxID=261939 RepID=Y054_OSHVF|nr:ORF54 [Ostreid herpesvirus 1]Q6R7H1.1 RecName: Full=Uncharacterized protein ORF54; Flags: Precursor [Ostreid herpesvirus 1 (isolate France)]AAS00944.1 ORF54 [Ostreid herpesvirus 1]AHC31283.1 hypothetical protein [Ostreid herpesvirus 1]
MNTVLFVILLAAIGSNHGLIDERLTVNRMGYGVMFDKVSEIIDGGGIVHFSHTWSLIIPTYTIPSVENIDCTLLNAELTPICDSINNLIDSANTETYNSITDAKLRMAKALDVIPKSKPEDLINIDLGANLETTTTAAPQTGNRRRRRAAGDEPNTDDNTPPNLEIPDWLDPDKDNSDWEILIPGRLAGNLFTSIFDMPGSGTLKNSVRNLKALGGAIYTNTQSIINLNDQFAYIIQTTDKRMDEIQEMGDILVRKIAQTRASMVTFQNEFSAIYGNMSARILMLNKLKSMVVSNLYPDLFRMKVLGKDIETLCDMWTYGLINLASGYISPQLITETMMKHVIDHIVRNIIPQPTYNRFNLLSTDPAFYYKMKKMLSYARTADKVIVTINIPLYRTEGRMPLYRIYSFPIPLTMGTEDTSDKGYTKMADLPDFIAVDSNTDAYVEMTQAAYLSCSGAVSGIQSCGNAVGVTKRRDVTDMTCAFAIFIDDTTAIGKFCQTAYSDVGPVGSARQLASDSSFLISSGEDTDSFWTVNCPKSTINPISKVVPCNLCRMEISCGCSLSASHFKLNPRIGGCEKSLEGVPKTTKIYSRNMAAVTEFVTDEDLKLVNSYSARVDKLYPPIKMEKLEFKTYDNVEAYAEKSRKYGQDFIKGAELMKKNLTIYKDKVDEGLKKARDFSDQVVDREGSIINAISGLFTDIFGGEVWAVIAAIFSPVFLTAFALIISLINFIPAVRYDYKQYKKEKREKRYEEQRLALLGEADDEMKDSYGNYVKYSLPYNAATYVDIVVDEIIDPVTGERQVISRTN